MEADGIDRCLDVSQWLPLAVRHSSTRSRSTRARTAGLRSLLVPGRPCRRGWRPGRPGHAPVRAGPCAAAELDRPEKTQRWDSLDALKTPPAFRPAEWPD